MQLILSEIKYHRGKDFIVLKDAQALLMVSDLVTAALAQSGFSADIEVQNEDD